MKAYQIRLLRKQFPFLDHLFVDQDDKIELWLEDIDRVKVEKGDSALMAKVGQEDSYHWVGGGHYGYTIYFAVWGDKDHEEIIQLDTAGRRANEAGGYEEWDADIISGQLLTKAPGIHPDYIVECVKNDHDDNGNGEVTRFWTVYIMSKFNLVEYHCQQIDLAAAQAKACMRLIYAPESGGAE